LRETVIAIVVKLSKQTGSSLSLLRSYH